VSWSPAGWWSAASPPRRGQRAGQEIRRHEIVIDEIGVSLRYATARPVKAHRNGDLHVVEDDENA